MSDNQSEGYVALALTIGLFGSYGVGMKSPKVIDLQIHPLVFMTYFSAAVGAVLLFVLTYLEFHFSGWGILGAAMFIASQIIAYMAIHRIGYALALAIWAGVTVLVGFLIGLIGFGDVLSSVPGSIGGIVVLVAGIVGIVLVPSYIQNLNNQKKYLLVHATDLYSPEKRNEDGTPKSTVQYVTGVGLSIIMGFINGALQVPLYFYSQQFDIDVTDAESVSYLASFAIGCLAVTPAMLLIYFGLKREWPVFHFRHVFLPGIVTGVIWALGYTGATYSTIWLGFAIGYPATQACILVAGLWGVFYFKEVQGVAPIAAFFLFAVMIITGVLIMSYFGQPP